MKRFDIILGKNPPKPKSKSLNSEYKRLIDELPIYQEKINRALLSPDMYTNMYTGIDTGTTSDSSSIFGINVVKSNYIPSNQAIIYNTPNAPFVVKNWTLTELLHKETFTKDQYKCRDGVVTIVVNHTPILNVRKIQTDKNTVPYLSLDSQRGIIKIKDGKFNNILIHYTSRG